MLLIASVFYFRIHIRNQEQYDATSSICLVWEYSPHMVQIV